MEVISCGLYLACSTVLLLPHLYEYALGIVRYRLRYLKVLKCLLPKDLECKEIPPNMADQVPIRHHLSHFLLIHLSISLHNYLVGVLEHGSTL